MPYCFSEGDPGWDEQVEDDRPPRISQFRYLPPPDVGGAPDPVRFSDTPPPDPAVSTASVARGTSVAPAPSLLDRLLGRTPRPRPGPLVPSWEERQRQNRLRGEQWMAHLVTALRQIGARRAYCRYDGGNDEGFAWLDHVELNTGERLSAEVVAERLTETDVLERLHAAKLLSGTPGENRAENLRGIVSDALAIESAALLLGQGYGTGPYWLYGAFTIDLDACTILDDRQAEPIVENIQLER